MIYNHAKCYLFMGGSDIMSYSCKTQWIGVFCFFMMGVWSPVLGDSVEWGIDRDYALESVNRIIQGDNYKAPEYALELMVDVDTLRYPKSVDEFHKIAATPPPAQQKTGGCWCYSATSLLESEVIRQQKKQVDLSEPYTIYWEYINKAESYIKSHGSSYFSVGSQPNAAVRVWKKYGIVPFDVYKGRGYGQESVLNHFPMFYEMKSILTTVQVNQQWDEPWVMDSVKSVLNKYLGGNPPSSFVWNGNHYTPQSFMKDYLKINPDEFVDVLSLGNRSFYQWVDYSAPDNWWHADNYWNVPIDDFHRIANTALKNGYTVVCVGDINEPGYRKDAGIAIVPTFDVPPAGLTDESKLYRFLKGETSDDHAIQLIGYLKQNGYYWYLARDTGTTGWNSNHPGYFFIREDYFKFKMMNLLVHRDALNKARVHFMPR